MTEKIFFLSILAIICLFVACSESQEREKLSTAEKKEAIVVHVEFVNAEDQSIIGTSDMPLDQLPDSFRIETTLELAEKNWSVVSADPTDKTEFSKTGRLRVVLTEIRIMPPGDLLYSLPTISNDFGQAVGDVLPHPGLFQIHEDDWRQIEFISQIYKKAIDQEFADIRTIFETKSSGLGFKRVHVRKRIPIPLSDLVLTVKELKTHFPPTSTFEAVSFFRTAGSIPESFAWTTDLGPVIWGYTDTAGRVLALCLELHDGNKKKFANALANLTREKQVILVDWCRVVSIAGDSDAFENYLAPKE